MAQYTHPSKTKFIFTIRFHQWTKNKINYKMKSVQRENKNNKNERNKSFNDYDMQPDPIYALLLTADIFPLAKIIFIHSLNPDASSMLTFFVQW